MMECIFCDQEKIKSQILYETDTEFVVYNIRKSNRGRLMVIPKRHISSIREMTHKELAIHITRTNWNSQIVMLGVSSIDSGQARMTKSNPRMFSLYFD